jgi:cytochrome P450
LISAQDIAEQPATPAKIPDGPKGLPYFGCLNRLLRNPMEFWTDVATRYGGIALVPLMRERRVYLISDPKLLYELLVTKRSKYRKNVRYKAAVDTFGAGLLLNEGAAWKRQRLLTQPAFKNDFIAAKVTMMAELTSAYLNCWNEVAGQSVARDVDADFFGLSQRIAGHYLMGSGFAEIETEFGAAARAIKENWPLPPRNVLALLRPQQRARERRLGDAVALIDECLLGFLAARRRENFQDCGVLEQIAVGSREQGKEFDDRSLRDQLLTLFFAGHETSATSLSWIHYLLSENQDVLKKMQAEIAAVVGARADPSAAELDKLHYMEQVINESLRMYSPIHSISRVALEDDTIGDYSIPAGAMIYISLHAMHRLPSLWPDPERFDPERFSPEAMAKQERFAVIPFAAGHRNCIGAAMAVVELKIVMTRIAQRFVLKHDPAHKIVPTAGTVMHPRGGMPMFITRRPLP